jgi:acyl dehydratase
MRSFTSTEELTAAKGEDLGVTDWTTMTQERVNTMADAIDDHQWIHVDEERAKDGPYGGTIAHGYLTLALVPTLAGQVFDFSAWGTLINYGLEKVRFPNPVRVGDRVRARVRLADVADKAGGILVTLDLTMEIEGQERPGCISRVLILLLD